MTNPVFLIPDVLSEILEQVDYSDREPHWLPVPRRPRGPRTLARCLLVNKLWFSEASRILWRKDVYLRYLNGVDNKARQQHYAKMIKQLTVNNIDEAHERFQISGLESLVMFNKHKLSEGLLSLLVPTLKHVQIICPSIEFFEKLEQDCPLVECLKLNFSRTFTEEDLEKVKRYLIATSAVSVEVSGLYIDVLLPALARNEYLQELNNLPISIITVRSTREKGGMQTFKNLRMLSCKIGCGVRVRDLLELMPNLERVVVDTCRHEPLKLRDRLSDVLQFASVKLKRIRMAAGVTHVDKSLLLALADKYRQLESVQLHSLRPDYTARDSSENLDDEFAHEFTSRVPNLRALELEFHGSLTAEGLVRIGENCRHLEILDLYGEHKLRRRPVTWRKRPLFYYPRFCIEKEPLFPRLIFLAPTVKLRHLPRSMQEYHFPRIFYQREQSCSVLYKGQLHHHWQAQQLPFDRYPAFI